MGIERLQEISSLWPEASRVEPSGREERGLDWFAELKRGGGWVVAGVAWVLDVLALPMMLANSLAQLGVVGDLGSSVQPLITQGSLSTFA